MQREKHYEIFVALKIYFYFCKPFHSWERGANEKTKGLIKQKYSQRNVFQ